MNKYIIIYIYNNIIGVRWSLFSFPIYPSSFYSKSLPIFYSEVIFYSCRVGGVNGVCRLQYTTEIAEIAGCNHALVSRYVLSYAGIAFSICLLNFAFAPILAKRFWLSPFQKLFLSGKFFSWEADPTSPFPFPAFLGSKTWWMFVGDSHLPQLTSWRQRRPSPNFRWRRRLLVYEWNKLFLHSIRMLTVLSPPLSQIQMLSLSPSLSLEHYLSHR